MILLSVGTQLPFDRLIRAVDTWAYENGQVEVIGQTGHSSYTPRGLKSFPFLDPQKFRSLQEQATLHIAHAGMGSILTAMELGKPILIMPRDHTQGEHRNGHQLATAKRFVDTPGVFVAFNEQQVIHHLRHIENLAAPASTSAKAPDAFLSQLRASIEGVRQADRRADSLQPGTLSTPRRAS